MTLETAAAFILVLAIALELHRDARAERHRMAKAVATEIAKVKCFGEDCDTVLAERIRRLEERSR